MRFEGRKEKKRVNFKKWGSVVSGIACDGGEKPAAAWPPLGQDVGLLQSTTQKGREKRESESERETHMRAAGKHYTHSQGKATGKKKGETRNKRTLKENGKVIIINSHRLALRSHPQTCVHTERGRWREKKKRRKGDTTEQNKWQPHGRSFSSLFYFRFSGKKSLMREFLCFFLEPF